MWRDIRPKNNPLVQRSLSSIPRTLRGVNLLVPKSSRNPAKQVQKAQFRRSPRDRGAELRDPLQHLLVLPAAKQAKDLRNVHQPVQNPKQEAQRPASLSLRSGLLRAPKPGISREADARGLFVRPRDFDSLSQQAASYNKAFKHNKRPRNEFSFASSV